MKLFALTFGTPEFDDTKKRYVEQLKATSLFQEVMSMGISDLGLDFHRDHGPFIQSNPRAYGYFIWKPWIIKRALEQLNDGDILVYGDAGNTMVCNPEKLIEIFGRVQTTTKTPLLACYGGWNIRWTKTDVFLRTGLPGLICVLKKMVAANRIVIKKTPATIQFVDEWWNLSTINYANIDNSPSKLFKLPFFIEHRWDQSLLSILFHKYHCELVDFGSVWLDTRIRSMSE